jgi:hypothetical protein
MKFIIDTDLTTEGTLISIDGKNVSDERNVSSITFYADAPNKKYEDDGYISLSISSFDKDGNIKNERYGVDKAANENIKPIGISDNVAYEATDVIRYLGDKVESEKIKLVDEILKLSAEKKLACPDKNVLLNRSIDSLKYKATDLGFTSDDS